MGGEPAAGAGVGVMRLPTHRLTTANLQAAYPFMHEAGLGGDGVYIGRQILGGSFCYDPWVLYARGVVTSPNMLIAGQVGRGKSALIKTMLWRQAVFGRRAFVLDPKGEYAGLADILGATPIRLGGGSPIRLNPLDAPPGAEGDAVRAQRVALVAALAAATLRSRLSAVEQTAIELAVDAAAAADPTGLVLPAVVELLLWPTADAAQAIGLSVEELANAARNVALALRRLCRGDLAGLFDSPTTPGLDLDGAIVVLDLSAVYGSQAQSLLMLCALSWLQAAIRGDTYQRLVVVDEAWAVLRDAHVARWLSASWKLSRQWGVANVAVVHRLSDLSAAGPAGSEQEQLARGLLADSETRIIYAQSSSEVAAARDLLGLSDTEATLLPGLGRGVALWRVGAHRFLIAHQLSVMERGLVDTDARMATNAREFRISDGASGGNSRVVARE